MEEETEEEEEETEEETEEEKENNSALSDGFLHPNLQIYLYQI
ncbi:MAG: hypothetical protein OXC44_07440 [Proteobacteria bacterium]|nr:hypothetical protein [Pseudomonadota bacterium]